MDRRLQNNKLFQDIDKEEIEKMLICAKAKEREYQSEEYIFRQEQKPSKLFLLIEGSVMIAKDFASGKRDVLFFVCEGEVFGEKAETWVKPIDEEGFFDFMNFRFIKED